jgi:hypothetical protein
MQFESQWPGDAVAAPFWPTEDREDGFFEGPGGRSWSRVDYRGDRADADPTAGRPEAHQAHRTRWFVVQTKPPGALGRGSDGPPNRGLCFVRYNLAPGSLSGEQRAGKGGRRKQETPLRAAGTMRSIYRMRGWNVQRRRGPGNRTKRFRRPGHMDDPDHFIFRRDLVENASRARDPAYQSGLGQDRRPNAEGHRNIPLRDRLCKRSKKLKLMGIVVAPICAEACPENSGQPVAKVMVLFDACAVS